MVQNSSVAKILLAGGAAFSVFFYSLSQIVNNKLKESAAYHDAIKMIKTEEVPKEYLGEPIVEGYINIVNSKSYGDEGEIRWITIPVEGQKQSGYLKYWFHSNEIKHTLLQVELLDNSNEEVIFYKKVQGAKNVNNNNKIVNKAN